MVINDFIKAGKLLLRNIEPDCISDSYYHWMNDAEIVQYLEIETGNSKQALSDYVRQINNSTDSILFGIYDNKSHIGNIKLGPLVHKHCRASIGVVIGDKNYWGKGVASAAIENLVEYAFSAFDLKKLTAGCYAPNKGAIKAFIKNGFVEEARLKNHVQINGVSADVIVLAKHN